MKNERVLIKIFGLTFSLVLLFLVLFLASPVLAAEITNIYPNKGPVGTEVTIYGTDLSSESDISSRWVSGRVCFGKACVQDTDLANFISWNKTEIKVKVPEGASDGPIYVGYADNTPDTSYFEYEITGPTFDVTSEPYTPTVANGFSFFPYDKNFKGGVDVAMGDIDGDGVDELIVGAGPGGGPHVRTFEIKESATDYARYIPKDNFFPFHPNFRGGVNVAAGDVDGDGKDEIICAQASKGEAWIKVYKANAAKTVLFTFLAYGRGVEVGADVAAGDFDGDGKDEIVTGPGPTGGPHLRVFESDGRPTGFNFFPFHPHFRGGLRVDAGDIDGDGKDDVVTAQASNGEAWIKAYRVDSARSILSYFRAYDAGQEHGADVALFDVTGNGKADILTVPRQGGSALIRFYNTNGKFVRNPFYAYTSGFKGGASITGGVFKFSGVNKKAVSVGAGPGGGPNVRPLLLEQLP